MRTTTSNLTLPVLTQILTADATQFNRTFDQAEARLLSANRRMGQIGATLTATVTLPLQLMGIVAVREFAKLDQAVTKTMSKLRTSAPEIREQLQSAAIGQSMQSKSSAAELAAGMEDLAASGMNAAETIAALPVVEKFATAGAMQLDRASEALLDTTTALGLRTKDTAETMANMVKVSDVMVQAADSTTASVEDFAMALTHKAATAMKDVNMGLEEGVAVLMAYAERGIKSALAGEKLAVAVRDVQTAAIRNADAWKRMNMEIYDSEGALKPMPELLSMLEERFEGATDQQRQMAVRQLGFTDRSRNAIQTLIGLSKAIKLYEVELKNAAGATEDVYNIQMSSFTNQMLLMRNQITAVGIDIGQSLVPALMKANVWLKGAAQQWMQLDGVQKGYILSAILLAAALGPVLIALSVLVKSIQILVTPIALLIGLTLRLGFVFAQATISLMGFAVRAAVTAGILSFQLAQGLLAATIGMFRWVQALKLGTTWTLLMNGYFAQAIVRVKILAGLLVASLAKNLTLAAWRVFYLVKAIATWQTVMAIIHVHLFVLKASIAGVVLALLAKAAAWGVAAGAAVASAVATITAWAPVILVIAAVTAALAGMVLLILGPDGVKQAWVDLKTVTVGFFSGVASYVTSHFTWLSKWLDKLKEIKYMVTSLWNLKNKYENASGVSVAGTTFNNWVNSFAGFGAGFMPDMSQFMADIKAETDKMMAQLFPNKMVPGKPGMGDWTGGLAASGVSGMMGTVLQQLQAGAAAMIDPSAFDPALLLEQDKRKRGGSRQGFSATALGTAEEYSARVGGQGHLTKLAEKQLHEQKQNVLASREIKKAIDQLPSRIGDSLDFAEAGIV